MIAQDTILVFSAVQAVDAVMDCLESAASPVQGRILLWPNQIFKVELFLMISSECLAAAGG